MCHDIGLIKSHLKLTRLMWSIVYASTESTETLRCEHGSTTVSRPWSSQRDVQVLTNLFKRSLKLAKLLRIIIFSFQIMLHTFEHNNSVIVFINIFCILPWWYQNFRNAPQGGWFGNRVYLLRIRLGLARGFSAHIWYLSFFYTSTIWGQEFYT